MLIDKTPKQFRHKAKRQKNKPPITGEGIQKLFRNLRLFFNTLPNKKSMMVRIKVYVELRSILNKLYPPFI